jgi:quinol monooxygenase YgiN
MATNDKCCTIGPYFKVHEGRMEAFKDVCERFLNKAREEPACLYYGWSFLDDQVHCREGYKNAEGVLAHLDNVGELLQEALTMADLTRLEIHGPETELKKLRGPLAEINPAFFVLEYGFRR